MTNTEWTIALQRGDKETFTLLYNRHWKALYKQALSRVKEESIAQDIIQDVFIGLWEKRERLVITTSVAAFLAGCVKVQVLAYYKKERVRQQLLEQAMEHIEQAMEMEGIDQAKVDRSLQEALTDIPEKMKQSFLLRCDNRSIREIAEILGIAEQSVSNNLHEVVKRLRRKIVQQYPGEYLTCLTALLSLVKN